MIKLEWVVSLQAFLQEISKDNLKYLALITVAILIWSLKQSYIILFPKEDTKKLLQSWPKYFLLKDRIFIGIAFQLFFCISAISYLITPVDQSPLILIALFPTSLIGSPLGAATLFLSTITINEIMLSKPSNLA